MSISSLSEKNKVSLLWFPPDDFEMMMFESLKGLIYSSARERLSRWPGLADMDEFSLFAEDLGALIMFLVFTYGPWIVQFLSCIKG